jgi:threonine dehydrogenase-like Zn-dependent dehydrogenase
MEVVDMPEPAEPRAGEVVVRPEAIGICGSDFHFFEGELEVAGSGGEQFPRIQGHEVAGIIEAVGTGCRRELEAGRRVALWPLSSCGECYPCSVGRGNVCDNFRLIGIHDDGGLQERLPISQSQVFPIEEANPAVAALAEPVSIAVRAAHRAAFRSGERVVVLGAGPIGQAVSLLARDRDASVLMIDRVQSRVELSREMGAEEAIAWSDAAEVEMLVREWAGEAGPPVVVDATGAPGAIRAAVDMAASAGRVIVVGMSGAEVPLRIGSFTEKELDVLGVSCCGGQEFAEAVGLVERHSSLLERLVSHEFPLERAPDALVYAMENPTEVMKVVIRTDRAPS